jgi:tight adherence protein C
MSADTSPTSILGLVFAAVVMACLQLHRCSAARSTWRPGSRRRRPASTVGTGGQSLRTDHTSSLGAPCRRGRTARPFAGRQQGPVLKDQLMLAGYSQPYAVRAFVLIRTVLTLALPADRLSDHHI